MSGATGGRRILAVHLPAFASERVERRHPDLRFQPLALIQAQRGQQVISAVNRMAAKAGVRPGMRLADARALLAALAVQEHDPVAESRALSRLAQWCTRYTPSAAPAGVETLLLDITGCAGLFGGEAALGEDLARRLKGFQFTARLAIADTPALAQALATHAASTRLVAVYPACASPSEAMALVTGLPIAALRLPAALDRTLAHYGLKRVGHLLDLDRGSLRQRFGEDLVVALDRLAGLESHPISPLAPERVYQARRAFAEPLGRAEDVALGLRALLGQVCAQLEQDHRGAREVLFQGFNVDGHVGALHIGTVRAERDPTVLAGLFAPKLEQIRIDYGLDALAVLVPHHEPLGLRQTGLRLDGCQSPQEQAQEARDGLTGLLNRLGNRLGFDRLVRLTQRPSWWPETAVQACPAAYDPQDGPASAPAALCPSLDIQPCDPNDPARPRPLSLLPRPIPVEATAPVPDDPPVLFRWRGRVHRVRRADGPERLYGDWWGPLMAGGGAAGEPGVRDYYRVEDTQGRRFWLYREGLYAPGVTPRWFLQGAFA